MRNKLSRFLVVGVCVLGVNEMLWGQTAAATHPIRGYLDPQTGTFHVLPRLSSEDVAAAATTGKFVFNFTITVDATISSTAKILCVGNVFLPDTGSGNIITEQAGALATRSGTTATCTVTIPYSWNLTSASTDRVSLGYTIEAPAEASSSASEPSRLSSQDAFKTIALRRREQQRLSIPLSESPGLRKI